MGDRKSMFISASSAHQESDWYASPEVKFMGLCEAINSKIQDSIRKGKYECTIQWKDEIPHEVIIYLARFGYQTSRPTVGSPLFERSLTIKW